MSKWLLAHDLGTSGNKATLFTTQGELLDSCVYAYPTRFFNGNWAEQNPLDWWQAFCETNRRLLQGRDASHVAAVAFSGQMMGCVCVDKQGNLLRDAIIWADQRSVEEERFLRERIDPHAFYRITGHRPSASYSLEKLMWIRNHEPAVFQQTHCMLQPKDYLIFRLTGKLVTDYSDASGTNAYDLLLQDWSDEIIQTAGLPREMFPSVHPSTHVVGEITSLVARACGLAPGTPVVLGGGDGVCAAVGAASVEENTAYNYLGSSSWVSYTAKEPVFDEQMRTFNWAHLVPGYYAPTGTMQAAGNSYHFIKKLLFDGMAETETDNGLSLYPRMDQHLRNSPPGAHGLLFLPYLLGERSPRWNPDARGALIGLKMEHTKSDILRATVEGILMNLAVIVEIFGVQSPIDSVNVIGGLAQSEPILEMLTDIYGIKAHKLHHLEEATSIGAAIAAGVGCGELKDFSVVREFIRPEKTYFPNEQGQHRYEQVKAVFEKSYVALLPVYDELCRL